MKKHALNEMISYNEYCFLIAGVSLLDLKKKESEDMQLVVQSDEICSSFQSHCRLPDQISK